MTAHLVRGDARALPLADRSVQCIVTSPPYFGLRSYGGQSSIWGGDPECFHNVWSEHPGDSKGWGGASGKIKRPESVNTSNAGAIANGSTSGGAYARGNPRGATCTLCGAWRGELGSEPTPALFVAHIVEVMRECWRVLRDDGVAFVNMGDSYAGSGKGPTGHNGIGDQGTRQGFTDRPSLSRRGGAFKSGAIGDAWVPPPPGYRQKSLLLVPERLAVALSDDGWIVRSRIAWCKAAPMPESVRDRPTSAWEHVFLLSKNARYFWDSDAARERPEEIGAGEAGVVDGANFSNEVKAFLDDFWTSTANRESLSTAVFPTPYTHLARAVAVRLAPAILDFSESKDDVCLPGLDSEIRSNGTQRSNGHAAGGLPIHQRAARLARRWLALQDTTEEFMSELYRLRFALPHHEQFIKAWRGACRDVLSMDTYSDRSIGVNDSGEVGQIGLFHTDNYTTTVPGRSSGRNLWNYWLLRPDSYAGQHFATYPRELVRRCVAAATSERGACAACGAPWARVVERSSVNMSGSGKSGNPIAGKGRGDGQVRPGHDIRNGQTSVVKHLNWTPSCRCGPEAGVRPQIVLDPFSGSGTTAYVAASLGRVGVGVELSAEYTAQARYGRLAQEWLPL